MNYDVKCDEYDYISVCIHNSFIYIYNRITQIWKHFIDYFIIKDYT